eukprot:GHUV01031580.1.p1 GENE.GHUV01031580.1~~GHUV01031580.1.p1  ORF type:complete len:105 (+),score=10.31 GHUV01031580.1:410-724(+)
MSQRMPHTPAAAALADLLVIWHHLLSRQVVLDDCRCLEDGYASVWSDAIIVHRLDGTIWQHRELFATKVDAKRRVLQVKRSYSRQQLDTSPPGRPKARPNSLLA